MSLRLKKRGEKVLERALVISSPQDSCANEGLDSVQETIREESPMTPLPSEFNGQLHRRETANGE
jgi:hypothetical protein